MTEGTKIRVCVVDGLHADLSKTVETEGPQHTLGRGVATLD